MSKNWLYLQYASLALNIIASLTLTFTVPESPKFLHSKGDFHNARKLLYKIAQWNKVKNYQKEFQFV